jgi:hypothetical protein
MKTLHVYTPRSDNLILGVVLICLNGVVLIYD